MKLLSIILKELNLLKSQKSALALIIIFPIIIIAILGLGFSNYNLGKIDVGVVVSKDLAFLKTDLSNIKGSLSLNIIEFNSLQEALPSMKQGKIKLILLIEKYSSNSNQLKITLIKDNTKVMASTQIAKGVSAGIQSLILEKAQTKFLTVWQNFLSSKPKLDDLNSIESAINRTDVYLNDVNNPLNNKLVSGSFKDLNLQSVKSDLNEAKQFISGLKSAFSFTEQVNPNDLLKPVYLYEDNAFKATQLQLIIPSGLLIVLMLTCMLLSGISVISERQEGSLLRMNLSKANKLELFAGKLIGQLLIAFFLSIVILGIGILAFHLPIQVSFLELFLALLLISFCFISLGLFIACFVSNQSTVVLLSLILMIPMLFLSGILMPIDFMPPAIKFFSESLPLTVSNDLLVALMIKGTALSANLSKILFLLIPGIFFSIIAIWKNK